MSFSSHPHAVQLTARQQQILDYIQHQIAHEGLPPTRDEITRHFGFASPNSAQSHLRALERHGVIELRPGRARGIVLATPSMGAASDRLPVIGRVAAGTPLLAVENLEDELQIDRERFHPRPDYALRVRGQSMTGAGIHDGDLVLVHRSPEARTGQIVVARIEDEVTVKRLRMEKGSIFLDSENPAWRPIRVHSGADFAIEGLVVGCLRIYSDLAAPAPSR